MDVLSVTPRCSTTAAIAAIAAVTTTRAAVAAVATVATVAAVIATVAATVATVAAATRVRVPRHVDKLRRRLRVRYRAARLSGYLLQRWH